MFQYSLTHLEFINTLFASTVLIVNSILSLDYPSIPSRELHHQRNVPNASVLFPITSIRITIIQENKNVFETAHKKESLYTVRRNVNY